MKNVRKSTWIAIGCVALAILASRVYSTMQENSKIAKEEEVAVISEISGIPTPPAPIATPKASALPAPIAKEQAEEIAVAPVNAPSETAPAPTEFQLPSTGEVQLPYSDTELVYFEPLREWRCHLGIDFLPSENDVVTAVAGGTVARIYEDHLYGKTVVLDHGHNLKSFYASLSSVQAEEGEKVEMGAEIGRMGETAAAESGVHLHFFMEKDGKIIDPFGPK